MQQQNGLSKRLKQESVLALLFLAGGLLLLPFAVFIVGAAVFGDYPGGYPAFFGDFSRRLRAPQSASWFLVVSPYLVWQTARITLWALRRSRPGRRKNAPAPVAGDS